MSARLTERELIQIRRILRTTYLDHPDARALVCRITAHIDSLPFTPTQPKENR